MDETSDPVTKKATDSSKVIDTAVEFLRNPKIFQRPQSEKVSFLKNKGLTEQQILEAFEKVEGFPVGPLSGSMASFPANAPSLPPHAQPHTVWTRVKHTTSTILFVTGVCFGCQYIFKTYLEPLLVGKSSKRDTDFLIEADESMMTVLVQIQKTLEKMSQTMEQQNKTLTDKSEIEAKTSQKTYANIMQLITEMKSLKSLMINRQSFPTVPVPSTALPRWQTQNKPVASDNNASNASSEDDLASQHQNKPETSNDIASNVSLQQVELASQHQNNPQTSHDIASNVCQQQEELTSRQGNITSEGSNVPRLQDWIMGSELEEQFSIQKQNVSEREGVIVNGGAVHNANDSNDHSLSESSDLDETPMTEYDDACNGDVEEMPAPSTISTNGHPRITAGILRGQAVKLKKSSHPIVETF